MHKYRLGWRGSVVGEVLWGVGWERSDSQLVGVGQASRWSGVMASAGFVPGGAVRLVVLLDGRVGVARGRLRRPFPGESAEERTGSFASDATGGHGDCVDCLPRPSEHQPWSRALLPVPDQGRRTSPSFRHATSAGLQGIGTRPKPASCWHCHWRPPHRDPMPGELRRPLVSGSCRGVRSRSW